MSLPGQCKGRVLPARAFPAIVIPMYQDPGFGKMNA